MDPVTEGHQAGPFKVRDAAVLALVRELVAGAGPLKQEDLGALLLELKRRREDEAKRKEHEPSSLDAAAEALLSIMEPNHQDHVRDVSYEDSRPAWVLICGVLARACDNRELRNGEFNPDWLNRPEAVVPATQAPRCEACRAEIPGGRRGQRFCCSRHGSGRPDHSDDCAVLIAMGKAPAAA